MKLRYLNIQNFCSAKHVELSVNDLQALVGANNSGKSNILKALNLLFNPSTKLIEEETFWNLEFENEIRIEAIFKQLDQNELDKLAPYLKPDDSFHMARTVNFESDEDSDEFDDGSISISQQYLKSVPIHDWLRQDKIKGKNNKKWWNKKEKLVVDGNSFEEFVGGSKPNVGEWKKFARQFVEEYLESEDFEEIWIDNPRGYAGVLKGVLPNYILIPAVQEVTEQAKVSSRSPFGQLIDRLMKNISSVQKEEVKQILTDIDNRLNRRGGKQRIDSIRETEEKLNDILRSYMPVDLEIEFQYPAFETLLSTPKLYADDGFRNSVENKGHGLQRAIIFSILQSYSELISEIDDGAYKTTIFGIEEPEIYMHPQAQRNLRNVFLALTETRDQIYFSTHSPNLLDVAYFDEIVRVETCKDDDCIKSKTWQLSVEELVEDLIARHPGLEGEVNSKSIRDRYSHAYHPNRSEGFFANKIILVEGATEQYAFPIYAQKMGVNLEKNNIAIVDCGGKGQLDRLYRIFNELGIPCHIVFDYDKASTDKETLRLSRELLDLFEYDNDPPDEILYESSFTCFPNSFETDVYRDIDEIDDLKSEARQFLGLKSDSGKPLVARYIARKLVDREEPIVPEPIEKLLNNAVKIEWEDTCLHKRALE
jgi:predicted ATP-dependent endonuclease of OLD family